MKIKSVFNILSEIRYMRHVLRHYGASLVKGRYVLFDGFRAMAHNDDAILSRAHIYFDKVGINPRMASVARKLNKVKYFKNKNNKSTEEYDAFYTANNYNKVREVKLFSFKQNKMLVVCTSKQESQNQISQYNLFGASYNMPEIRPCDKYPNSFEIDMVNIMPFPGDVNALNSIVGATVAFNKSVESLPRRFAGDLVKCSYENAEINSLMENLYSKIDSSIFDVQIPLCTQHGDLSKDNLIYGESHGKCDFWWIDWEHAAERLFFYDFFFYIINSAIYSDLGAYDLYMRGDLDEELEKLFSHFGLSFEKSKRRDYFLVFAVVFLKERVCNLGRVEALKKYCEFISSH